MFGLDDKLAGLGDGHALLLVLAVALLLGLRHATDPDHLAAVSTLIASDREDATRRAGVLGLSWGLGHATTLVACGVPIVIAGAYLPAGARQGAEVLIGVVIMLLAVRLLVRWRHGRFHAHTHRHGNLEHRHLHPHAASGRHAPAHTGASAHDHEHASEPVLGRSPLQAYGIGLVHGIGGSAGVGILLLAGIPDHTLALAALVLFALATAASMSLLSWSLGFALTRGQAVQTTLKLAPALGALSLAFGVWYTLGALEIVRYAL